MTSQLTQAVPVTRHVLVGLQPEPLASYLAGLGLIRLIGEQADPAAISAWSPDGLVIETSVADLASWLTERYQPTPVLSPWNSGSGFGVKDVEPKKRLSQLLGDPSPRLAGFRDAVSAANDVMARARAAGWITDDGKGDKQRVVQEFRNRCPEPLLPWIDACVTLAADKAMFPPLLGTGGNDGRLDFSTNFHEQLLAVLDASAQGRARSLGLARDLLAGTQTERLAGAPVGQFDPAGTGGQGSSPFGAAGVAGQPVEVRAAGRRRSAVRRRCVPAASARRGPGGDPVHRQVLAGRFGERRGRRGVARRGVDAALVCAVYPGRDQSTVRRGPCVLAWPPGPAGRRLLRGYPGARRGSRGERVRPLRAAAAQRPRVRRGAAGPGGGGGQAGGAARRQDRGLGVVDSEAARPPGPSAPRLRQFEAAHLRYARDGGALALRDLLAALTSLEQAVGRSGRLREQIPVRRPPAARDFLHVLIEDKDQECPELRIAVGIASCIAGASPQRARSMRQLLLPVDPGDPADRAHRDGRWRDAPVVPGFGIRPLRQVLADVLAWRSRTAADEITSDGSAPMAFRGVPTFLRGIPVPAGDLHALAATPARPPGGLLDEKQLDAWLRACLALDWSGVDRHRWMPAGAEAADTDARALAPAGRRPGRRRRVCRPVAGSWT